MPSGNRQESLRFAARADDNSFVGGLEGEIEMKRAAKLLLIAAFLVLALSGVALAASAQDIYNDYLANLRLEGTYTEVELRAFFGDASLHQYGDPALVTSLDTVVSSILTTERDRFPFTGA